MSGIAEFDVRRVRHEDMVVVSVRGELDLHSVEQLRQALDDPVPEKARKVLDLRDVTFMDSSALSLIVAEQRRARLENFRFVVATGGTRAVTRLLELSGLMETLEVVEDPGAVAQ